ncbi:serine hydrolase domain-containing protein [Corticicoccus populi]|uniref:Serine hydrolase domain-containing protein n=1 Tax=Corticicoccus populi TaxID=1812821 RepID=A0ABW5WT30_9STAP
MNKQQKLNKITEKMHELNFSGAYYAKNNKSILTDAHGERNQSERLKNNTGTRFSIASGSKIFTAAAVCMLVDEGKITFDSKISDCLDIEFPNFNGEITIHHLLTHTSGVPDYFNEEIMDDFEELWVEHPMYLVRNLKDFLPMFQHMEMQNDLNSSFQYNNTGYILLGLVVESLTKMSFTEYVETFMFKKASMHHSGYFEMDRLPENTAHGYIELSGGYWKSNIYSLPVKGGADGGAYVTASDRALFWKALFDGFLLSDKILEMFLKPRVIVNEEDRIFYGYCGYMELDENNRTLKYIQMGYDPGVNFREVYYPESQKIITVCSNHEEGAHELMGEVEALI